METFAAVIALIALIGIVLAIVRVVRSAHRTHGVSNRDAGNSSSHNADGAQRNDNAHWDSGGDGGNGGD